jgi:L-rhamnose isomerase
VINGERNATNGYKIKYTRATPVGAFRNKWDDWDRPNTLITMNASTMGSSIDGGYPVLFRAPDGELAYHYYDVSTEAADPGITTDRCWIRQRILGTT